MINMGGTGTEQFGPVHAFHLATRILLYISVLSVATFLPAIAQAEEVFLTVDN
jgi:hypothetical protein